MVPTRARLVLRGDAAKDFLAMYGNRSRRLNADANLLAVNVHYSDGYILTDSKPFTDLSSQDQHVDTVIGRPIPVEAEVGAAPKRSADRPIFL